MRHLKKSRMRVLEDGCAVLMHRRMNQLLTAQASMVQPMRPAQGSAGNEHLSN